MNILTWSFIAFYILSSASLSGGMVLCFCNAPAVQLNAMHDECCSSKIMPTSGFKDEIPPAHPGKPDIPEPSRHHEHEGYPEHQDFKKYNGNSEQSRCGGIFDVPVMLLYTIQQIDFIDLLQLETRSHPVCPFLLTMHNEGEPSAILHAVGDPPETARQSDFLTEILII